jgi:hypothetical protein
VLKGLLIYISLQAEWPEEFETIGVLPADEMAALVSRHNWVKDTAH